MIDILTNSFLQNPVPLQLTLNYCSHGCSFCFANLNNPKRKADLKGILSQLKNHRTRNDIVSYYLREKYPILISNNIDPFSKNNYKLTEQIIDVLLDMDIPVQLNTRGGYGWENVIYRIKPSLFYVSVPYHDDKIRERLEPNAPTLAHRLDFVKEVIKAGHKIIVGINPFNHTFCDDHTLILDQYAEIGVKYFWVNKLHLTYKQQANLTEIEKAAIGPEVLKQAAKGDYEDRWLKDYIRLSEYAVQKGCNIVGTPSGHYEPYVDDVYSVYPKLLPTQNDFFKWCEQNKEDGDIIEFADFFDFFVDKIPDIECNISKYVYQKAVLPDKSIYKKTKLSNLLHIYWDTKAGLKLPLYYPVFSWIKVQMDRKMDWLKDDQGDRVILYHPNHYNTEEFLILENKEVEHGISRGT